VAKLSALASAVYNLFCLCCVPLVATSVWWAYVGYSSPTERIIKRFGSYGAEPAFLFTGYGCFDLTRDVPIPTKTSANGGAQFSEYSRDNLFGGVSGLRNEDPFGAIIFETSFRVRYWVVIMLFSVPPVSWLFHRVVIRPRAKKRKMAIGNEGVKDRMPD
jgi:hypothetical protein